MFYKRIKIGGFSTSKVELVDLLKAWIAISIAFGVILMRREYGSLVFDSRFLGIFLLAGVTVGIGFLFHEMAHKFVAQHYGCAAEFRSSDQMLLFAVVLAFISGFVFAAPGAVMIAGHITKRENGIISVAGPATNLVVAVLFLLLTIFTPLKFLIYGFMINSWLAVFNMIPIWNLDGKKVLAWNKGIYFSVLAIGIFFSFFLFSLI